MIPLDKWSAWRRDLYLTAHNTHKKNIHGLPGFEPTIQASERPQTHALDRAAPGIGKEAYIKHNIPIRYNVTIMG
jgi:hypothetical protein